MRDQNHSLRYTVGRLIGLAALASLVLLLAGPSPAQTLAEIARKEEARRQALKGDVRIYTNKDLGRSAIRPPVPRPDPATAGNQPAATPATPETPAAEPPPDPRKDEKYWRDRLTQARDQVSRAEILQAALESRINALATDFVNRDDPAQRAVIAQDRQRAEAELRRTKTDIERLKKEIADIQEEARRAGVPPGWLR